MQTETESSVVTEQTPANILTVIGVVADVAVIAATLVKKLIEQGDEAEFVQEPLTWRLSDGQVYVRNQTARPLWLAYSFSQTPPLTITEALGPREEIDTLGLKECPQGVLTVSPQQPAVRHPFTNTLKRAISWSIRMLALGHTAQIIGGIKVKVEKGTFTLQFDPPRKAEFTASIADGVGSTLNVAGKVEKTAEAGVSEHRFPIPPGLNLQNVVDLQIDMEVEI